MVVDDGTEIAEGGDGEGGEMCEVESSVEPVGMWSDLSCFPEHQVVHDSHPHSHTADALV